MNNSTTKHSSNKSAEKDERRSHQRTPRVCYNALSQPKTGLVLTGGGARAAYQAGVLKAISKLIFKNHCGNPFPIIVGTSAGAINATVLASYAQNPAVGIRSLEKVWQSFSVDKVFRSDFKGILRNSARWTKSIFIKDYHRTRQLSLLDNKPLQQLLARVVHYDNIQKAIDSNHLDAICVNASGYTSGQSVSFFQGKEHLKGWKRHRRVGCAAKIERKHLLASSAIPLVFPAVKVNREFFGDGSVRFLAPLSPAIHLGAERILVIGVDPIKKEVKDGCQHSRIPAENLVYPTTADIAGHLLNSIFVDSLDSDLERICRINETLKLIPEKVRQEKSELKTIKTLSISPSQDLSELAGKYFYTLPPLLKFFFRRAGIDDDEGSTVLSYLLFESVYTKELIELGYKDAMDMSEQIINFFE